MKNTEIVSLKDLTGTKYSRVLCYPKLELKELEKRLEELERLGINSLEFGGRKRVFDVPVLGKGCVGIVVVANTNTGRVALKIRRIDADREEMFHEGEMLKRANSVSVGPKLLKTSENYLLMELVEGTPFPEWIESLEEKNEKSRLYLVLANILRQCFRLDNLGLDHGELSQASKHIILNSMEIPYLIDFETSSIRRRVANVTSICQYLFLGGKVVDKIKVRLGNINEKELINLLRIYKKERKRENFEKIQLYISDLTS